MLKSATQPGSAVLQTIDTVITSRWDEAVRRAAESSELDLDTRVNELSRSFARELGILGAAAGGTAAVPGFGTGAAVAVGAGEFMFYMTRTADLILTIGAMHGYSEASVEERRAWVLTVLVFGDGAAQGFSKMAGEVGKGLGKRATNAVPMPAIRTINKALGRTIVTKYGTKRGAIALGRLLPFGVGAAIGGGANVVLTRSVGRYAHSFFADLPDALRRDDVTDRREVAEKRPDSL